MGILGDFPPIGRGIEKNRGFWAANVSISYRILHLKSENLKNFACGAVVNIKKASKYDRARRKRIFWLLRGYFV